MKILITGDSGLLGANLCYLWRGKFDITGVSRGMAHVGGTRHVQLDLSDGLCAEKLVRDAAPGLIVHTAALVNVDRCEREPDEAKKLNADMTAALVDAAAEINARFVYISTDAFYEGEGDTLCAEEHPLTLGSVYAKTKREGEICALAYEKSLVLRTNIYGCNFQQKFSFGEWILRDLRAGKTLTMFTDVRFSPILVNDLAGLIEKAVEKKLTGVYNAGGSGGVSKYAFAVYLKKTFGLKSGEITPISVKNFSFDAWRSVNMSMDNAKIKKALGIEIPDAYESIERFRRLVDGGYTEKLREAAV